MTAASAPAITPVVIALKTITLALGGLITYFSFKAYRRTDAAALRALAIGFGAVTLGSLFAGVADQGFGMSTDYALVIESALTAIGFGIIVYSLYVE
jgi:hypothetical protein